MNKREFEKQAVDFLAEMEVRRWVFDVDELQIEEVTSYWEFGEEDFPLIAIATIDGVTSCWEFEYF